jgi:hypothetical protein
MIAAAGSPCGNRPDLHQHPHGHYSCRNSTRDIIQGQEHFLDYGHAFSSMITAGLGALALPCYAAGALFAARRTGRGQA